MNLLRNGITASTQFAFNSMGEFILARPVCTNSVFARLNKKDIIMLISRRLERISDSSDAIFATKRKSHTITPLPVSNANIDNISGKEIVSISHFILYTHQNYDTRNACGPTLPELP